MAIVGEPSVHITQEHPEILNVNLSIKLDEIKSFKISSVVTSAKSQSFCSGFAEYSHPMLVHIFCDMLSNT